VVDGAIMAAVADEIAEAAEEIEDSEIFEQILDVVTEVQEELEASTAKTCNGGANNGSTCTDDAGCPDGTCVATGLVFDATCSGGDDDGQACDVGDDTACPNGTCGGGVTIPSPTGSIQVNYICPGLDQKQFEDGYDAEPDSANGSIDLWMTLDSGGIGRVVWGTAAKCLYLVPIIGGSDCETSGCYEASYDGGVALDLGEDVSPGQDIDQLLVTFLIEGTIVIKGPIDIPCTTNADCEAAPGALPGIVCNTSTNTCDPNESDTRINQSFRVILADESFLEILVDLADPALSETFNYIFGETSQGIRAANGEFMCSLEQSRCFDENNTTLFSW
jgi:hypothetical protein